MTAEYENIIIKTTCRVMVPFLQLYALYVVIHGHYSPGGGFQGGVMMAASFILLVFAYGLDEVRSRVSLKGLTVFACLGLFIYSGTGALPLLLGANFLDYGALPLPVSHVAKARALGILSIEIGIFLGVMAVMFCIFLAIASYDAEEKG